jgi:hypothetical protein
LAATCFSQHAEIYRLSDADAKEGARLYDAMLNAEGDYKRWSHKMAYKVRDLEVNDQNHVSELEFSADFKTAVPSGGIVSSGPTITGSSSCWGYTGSGQVIAMPCK